MSAADGAVLFAGGGELGARMRDLDWESTALGPVATWPQSLRTCVRIILTSRQPMFVWWGDQLINLYNDAYKTIVGGKHPGALGQPASLVWREIWDQVAPRAHSAMRRNEGTYDEALLLIMERNGYPEETYYTFSYSPVPNDGGGAGGILCANTDDTQRIIGERQLLLLRELATQTSEARSAEEVCTRAALGLSSNARDLPFALLYMLDHDKRSVQLRGSSGVPSGHEAAPLRIELGTSEPWPISQVLATQQLQLVSGSALPSLELPSGDWQKSPGQVAVLPLSSSGESGRSGVLVVGLNPFRLFDDSYRGFLTLVAGQIAASIANAEAYEQERRRAEALSELDRAKTAFFSNVSHEFRTPLTLMLGPLEDAMSSPEHQLSGENLDTAYRNALRLLKLVNALLDFSRIEAGRADARFEPTDLPALTADLASAFRSAVERAGLTFRVELSPLPEPIYVDHDMWEKIVLNLLSNALKFTFEGSIAVWLTLSEQQVELAVSDTGTGIPEHELDHVFKRFHRVQGHQSRTHEGSGIGLALVSELVRLHGGTISVKSAPGVGTTFTVRVPRGTAHLPQDKLGTRGSPSSTPTGAAPYVLEAQRWLRSAPERLSLLPEELRTPALPLTGLSSQTRILLADDNADMRDYLARLLTERFTVVAVADGAEALSYVQRELPDLVLSDVMMPNLDGFGLLRALRSNPLTRSLPFIMLSARAGEESRVEGLEAGADDYLIKPFSARELMARVIVHLQLSGLRKEAEQERARLYEIFMQTPMPVAVYRGQELRVEVANPAYCQMVGRDIQRGQTLHQVFPELGSHEVVGVLEKVLAQGQAEHVAEMLVPLIRGGVLRDAYFNFVAQPLRAAGAVEGVIVVALEVTEQVQARARINRLRDEAERANRAKDDFLSTLSHELRTPLNAIVGWSTLLRRGGLEPERFARALETVERNARVQARLVEDMLDLARIEQGKLVLTVGPLEMVRVVEAALEAVRPAADAKGVRLQPVLDSHAVIVGDADRLQQVVWNLLSNAIKFTPKGGRVQVRLRRHHSYVELVVADDGQGIEADFLPFVFERFRQADPSYTRKAGGLGLGLAIVRSLVELHGGTVDASSDGRNQGSTFMVKIPVAPLRADQVSKPSAPEPGAPARATFECPAELKGLRVLVVDDELESRELLKYLLEQCEAHVETVAAAHDVLRLLESGAPYDVLISDIGMPELDGYGLLRTLRARPARQGGSIPALALTAYARGEDRLLALKSGFNMHLSKPIDPAELLVVVATLVRDHLRRTGTMELPS